MSSQPTLDPSKRSSESSPQSIPLQDLARPPDSSALTHAGPGHTRGRSLLAGASMSPPGPRYTRLDDTSPSPTLRVLLPSQGNNEARTASGNHAAPSAGLGLSMPAIRTPSPGGPSRGPPRNRLLSALQTGTYDDDGVSPYTDPYSSHGDLSEGGYFGPSMTRSTEDSDTLGLTDSRYLAPISGSPIPTIQEPTTPEYKGKGKSKSKDRSSFQSVRFGSPNSPRQSRLGDDLPSPGGLARSRSKSFGHSLGPESTKVRRSISGTGSAVTRAGSIMRAMSQRVANIGNDDKLPDPVHIRKKDSLRRRDTLRNAAPPDAGLPPIFVNDADEERGEAQNPFNEEDPFSPIGGRRDSEKSSEHLDVEHEPPPVVVPPPWPETNPLRGKSLNFFPPDSWLRMRLCEVLVHPFTEPLILLLIMLQTILLAVESSSDDFKNPTANTWQGYPIDWAMLGLFIIYTLELSAKIIVSGFFFNAEEYSTRQDPKQGLRETVMAKYRTYFGPRRQPSVRAPRHLEPQAISVAISRTFTSAMMGGKSNTTGPLQYNPTTIEEIQRYQLARRAFFRHSLNRIDFVAVVSYWISFALGVTGIEKEKHLYLFKMISCLRILRLLWITNGTSIILKSLKKAAPLLVNVSFLVGFFWLLFAIVGMQAFKSSFSRSCTWIDPLGNANWTNEFQLCGGYLDADTGTSLPWVFPNGTAGTEKSKGFICPRGSVCVEGEALYSGTVSFDNIVNSLELVFVIMSANTFTDLMYHTTDSDYLAAALFFAAGIIIMLLWLTNLLIAVITSSFQVIREESKKSAFTGVVETIPMPMEDQPKSRVSMIKKIYNHTFWIWILVIVFGLVTQACRSSGMSRKRTNFLFVTEIVVTLILDFEITFRLVSDYRRFHKSWRNWFDVMLAIVTTVMLIPQIRNSGAPYAWLTIFQIVRIYRVVWAIPMTRKLIALVLGNVMGIVNLVIFVFLITFLVAILAVQLFRGDIPTYDDDGETVRTSFFSIWNSFLGMYQILSSENWTGILYSITSYQTHRNTAWMGAAFLIAWFILSYFILINMFIAVIQENFDVSEDEKRLEQVKAFLQKKDIGSSSANLSLSTIFRFGKAKKVKDPLDFGQSSMEMLLKDAVVKDFLDDDDAPPLNMSHTFDQAADISPGKISGLWGKFVQRVWHREPNPFYSTIDFHGHTDTRDPRTMAKEAVSATAMRKRAQREYLSRHPNYNTALFIFKPENPIRRLCQKIVGPGRGSERIDGVEPNKLVWYSFSAFIYAAIVTMVVLACVTTPLYQKEYFERHNYSVLNWFVWTDLAFAILFTVEAGIKIVADGAFWTPNAFLRSLWGGIDGVVLVTLWINVITSFLNDGSISRAVGAFKALRALRLLHISDSARDTFHSLIFVGGWRVLSAAFVSLSLLVPFAIYGLNLFNGKMASCNDGGSGIVNLSDCFGEYMATPFSNEWGFPAPRVASNPFYDFDNFASSLFILFQIVSQEGWTDVLWSAESITGVGKQPQDFASQGNAVFFVIFNLLATVFILTLFISVFMRTYTEETGVAFLTAEQRSWMELRKLLRQVNPSKRPSKERQAKWRDWCYKKAVQKHGAWSRTITVVLVLHLFLLMAEFYPEPYWWSRTRDFIFLAFTCIYLANIVIRIVGLSWARFRRSSWDLYSLISVAGTLITTFLLLSKYSNVTYGQLHKLFLVSLTLLLIPRNNALDQLFKTAAASLTSILNLLATWLILFLVYAIAMTQTFGLTRFGGEGTANMNFRDVPRALIVLFRMSVGEGWNQIMEDYANIVPPLCVDGPSFFESDCGSTNWARALFISWNILSMYIFVSLFVSLIYESFSYVYQRSSGHEVVNREETRRFKQAWATFDPQGTGYITKEQFPRLLGELSGVFAMRIYDREDSVYSILEDVRADQSGNRHSSIGTINDGINLARLNARIAQIDGKKVRERRHRYNIFYEEVMVSADPDRGISFTSVLMILAHYNIISDNKSLKLDEFLRRRARLQRVEEEVHRRVVVGFFDTMYWSRRFRRHLNRHTTSRITGVQDFDLPLDVPAIIVDGDQSGGGGERPQSRGWGDRPDSRAGSYGFGKAMGKDGVESEGETDGEGKPKMRATMDFSDARSSFLDMFGLGHDEAFSFQSHSRNSSRDSTFRARSPSPSPAASPLPARRTSIRSPISPSSGRSPGGLTARLHRVTSSVDESPIDTSEVIPERRGTVSRPVSTLGDVAMETFNDSAWGESLRRSFTVARRGSQEPPGGQGPLPPFAPPSPGAGRGPAI